MRKGGRGSFSLFAARARMREFSWGGGGGRLVIRNGGEATRIRVNFEITLHGEGRVSDRIKGRWFGPLRLTSLRYEASSKQYNNECAVNEVKL